METKKILLVDDDPQVLDQEESFFDGDMFLTYKARSGIDALSIVREEKPDIVFMSLRMPNMGGDKLCSIIKGDEDLRKIPVILVVDDINEDDLDRVWQVGCEDITVKPVNRRYFLAIAKRYLHIQFRKTPRHIARIRVHFGTNSENLLTDYAINVSTGGVFIETDNLLPLGTVMDIEFILPLSIETVTCGAKVAWVNSKELLVNPNLPVGMGLQFINISSKDMVAIREYIKKEALMPFW